LGKAAPIENDWRSRRDFFPSLPLDLVSIAGLFLIHPASDPGVANNGLPSNVADLEKRAEGWRPWRAYAAMYLCNAES